MITHIVHSRSLPTLAPQSPLLASGFLLLLSQCRRWVPQTPFLHWCPCFLGTPVCLPICQSFLASQRAAFCLPHDGGPANFSGDLVGCSHAFSTEIWTLTGREDGLLCLSLLGYSSLALGHHIKFSYILKFPLSHSVVLLYIKLPLFKSLCRLCLLTGPRPI